MPDGPMPPTLPMFPLPELLLYPQAVVPLQLFEPRYVRMMRDMLAAGEDRLVIAALKPDHQETYFGRPPCFEIAGVGRVSHVQETPDDRFTLLVHGESRVKLLEELGPTDLPYRRVKVMPLTEAEPRGDDADAVREELRAILESGTARLADPDTVSLGWMADVMLVQLPLDLTERHTLFSIIDPLDRARRVRDAWQRAFGRFDVDPESN
jgi:Lon protease-like protein